MRINAYYSDQYDYIQYLQYVLSLSSLKYYSLERWLLLWKVGYASNIGGGWNQCWSMHYVIQNLFSISITILNGLIHRTIFHRLSAAICIGRPICLCSSAAICIEQSICHRWSAAICIGQPICHPELAAICIDCTNIPPSSIWFSKSYWNSYRIVQGVEIL